MKKIILGCLILIIVTSIVAFAANIYLANSNVIRIGAEDVKFNNEIYLIDEKTYVPIRELSEKMQVPIIWNEEDNKVELLTDHKTVNTSKETIINEEVASFWAGQKSASDVAGIIQSRVEIYVNENR